MNAGIELRCDPLILENSTVRKFVSQFALQLIAINREIKDSHVVGLCEGMISDGEPGLIILIESKPIVLYP